MADKEPRVSLMGKLLTNRFFSDTTIFMLLILIVVVFSIMTNGTFFRPSNLESIALSASMLLILGAGVTVLLIAAGLDLSVGAVVAFGGVAAAKIMSSMTADLIDREGWPLWGPVLLGALATAGAGTLWGLINGIIVVKTKMPPFVATLAMSTVILGLTQVWTGGVNVSGAPTELQQAYGLGRFLGVPWPVVTALLIALILGFVLSKTRFGLRNFAIGANPEAARRAGINVDAHLVFVYALVGFLGGVAGMIAVSRFTTATITGYEEMPLEVITAVVIGGTSLWGGRGRMSGTVVGAFIPATLTSGFVVMGLPPFWQNVAVGCVLLVAVWVDQYRRNVQANS